MANQKEKEEKLYEMFNDINRVSKKHLHEDHEAYKMRKAKKYAKENNIECGIKSTYATGTRTYPDFGIYDYKKPKNKSKESISFLKKKEEEKESITYREIKPWYMVDKKDYIEQKGSATGIMRGTGSNSKKYIEYIKKKYEGK